MKNTAFYGYKESQASYGYKSAIVYKEEGQSKYRFLCASETVTFPFGTSETAEFNLVNSPVIGKVEGKLTLEQKEVELLYTRNNAFLFEQLRDKVLDFMALTPQFIGYKFTGTISFRPNDATNDLHKGTYTITPMDADTTPYYFARTECLEPIFFTTAIPDEISVTSAVAGTGSTGSNIQINVGTNLSGTVYKYDTVSKTTNKVTGTKTTMTVANGVAQIPTTAVSADTMLVIYAEPPSNNTTHSEAFTTVYITD